MMCLTISGVWNDYCILLLIASLRRGAKFRMYQNIKLWSPRGLDSWVSKEPAQNSLTQRLKSDYSDQMTQKPASTATASLMKSRPSFSLSTALHLNMPPSPARGASKWTHTNPSCHLLLSCAPQLRDGHTTSPVVQATELGVRKSSISLIPPWSQVLWPPPPFTSPCLLPVSISAKDFP